MNLSDEQLQLFKRDIVAFAEALYYIGPGQRIKLYDFQKKILRECTQKNSDGSFKYEVAVLSMPRRNGKSELSTIIGVWSLFFGGWGTEVLSIAVGGKQNATIIFSKAKRAIKYSPILYESVGDKRFLKELIEVPSLESSWEIKPSEVISSVGRGYSKVLFDEVGLERLHFGEQGEARDLFDSVSAGQATLKNRQIILSSTVGGQEGLLWDCINLAETDPKVYCFLTHSNLSPRIDREWLKRRKKQLTPNMYLHLHENRFFSGEDQLILPEDYDNAIDENARPMPEVFGDKYCISFLDLGIKHDSSVVCTIYRDADNRINIAEIKSWSPKLLKRQINIEEVEEYLVEIKGRLNVREFYVDPWQAMSLIQRLSSQLQIKEFPITSSSLSGIYLNIVTLFQAGRIRLFPDKYSNEMKLLRTEALNLRYKPSGESIKVSETSRRIHNDRILSFAAACFKLVKEYEDDAYSIGSFACVRTPQEFGSCPLFWPGEGLLSSACHKCENYKRAERMVAEVESIDLQTYDFMQMLNRVEVFALKIDGFSMGKGAAFTVDR